MTNILLQNIPVNNKTNLLIGYDVLLYTVCTQFVLIIILLIIIVKKKRSAIYSEVMQKVKSSKSVNVDMDNVMNSILLSKDLFKQLSSKCHPDRFLDAELNAKANEIYQEITKNKRNYNKLLELKEIAINELKINF